MTKVTYSGGWIAPDGEFFPVEYGKHGPVGRRIAEQKGIKLKSWEDLSEKGWIRIFGGAPKGWSDTLRILFPHETRGTQAQLNTIFELRQATTEAGEDASMLDSAIEDWEMI